MPLPLPSRPNVVVCVSDQLRAQAMGCYGDSLSLTPNLDTFAAAGTRWVTACSNSPVCSAARSVLFSGLPARSAVGTLANAGDPRRERIGFPEPTLGEVFSAAGYDTNYVGKWHLAPTPDVLGFSAWHIPDNRHRYTGQTFSDSSGDVVRIEDWAPHHELEQTRAFLAGRQPDDPPFLLVHSISPPHMPLADMPERYLDLVSPDDVSLRPNVFRDGVATHDADWFRVYLWDFLYYQERQERALSLPEQFDLRHLNALYAGSVAWTDDIFGELMRALDDTGHADDTVVLFTADHGDNLGSHGLFNKEYPTDESIRVPLLLRGPGVSAGATRTDVASLVDVAPTMAATGSLSADRTWAGRNLLGPATESGIAYLDTPSGHVGVRTADRLVALPRHEPLAYKPSDDELVGRPLVFNIVDDPFQLENRASEGLPGDLMDFLLDWERRTPRLQTDAPLCL